MASIDDEIKTNFQNDQQRLLVNVLFTATWVRNKLSKYLDAFNISEPQMNILRILRGASDWVSMTTIKSLMLDKSPNATRLSDKLLAKGLIERKRGTEDRRTVYLSITQAGLDLLVKIDQSGMADELHFLERITPEEARTFSDLLDRMRGES